MFLIRQTLAKYTFGNILVLSDTERWRTNSTRFVQSGLVGVGEGVIVGLLVAEGTIVAVAIAVSVGVGVGAKVAEGRLLGTSVAEGTVSRRFSEDRAVEQPDTNKQKTAKQ
jgi:hypothetical protein